MATTAQQIDALWAGLSDPDTGQSYSGAIVGFFAAGTTTPQAVWYDKDKTLPTAAGVTQATLSGNGVLEVYGDGVYKINIYDPTDTGLVTPLAGSVDGVTYIVAADSSTDTGYDSISDMRAGDGGAFDGFRRTLLGYYAASDRGEGEFYWDASSTAADNNGTIIKVTSVTTGRWVRLFQDYITPYMFGAVGDGVADDTTAMSEAYAYCKSFSLWKRIKFRITAGKYNTSSMLTWDGEVDVHGDSPEKSVIQKTGNYSTLTITTSQSDVRNFSVDTSTGAKIVGDTGHGIIIASSPLTSFTNIQVTNQGGDGILQTAATSSTFRRIVTRYNGGSGFVLDSIGGALNNNANTYEHVDSLGNDDHGFWVKFGDNDYNHGMMIECQQNGKNGFYCDGRSNSFSVYGEVNDQDDSGSGDGTYRDVRLESASIRNVIEIIDATNDNAVYDVGTNNMIINNGTSSVINLTGLAPRVVGDNNAGRTLTITGGAAGAGATGKGGGALNFEGGAAAGTTGDANGGDMSFNGGAPVNSGRTGYIAFDTSAASSVIVGSATPTSVSSALEVKSTTGALLVSRMTTGERDALTAVNGMIIYNSTTGIFEAYQGGSWQGFVP